MNTARSLPPEPPGVLLLELGVAERALGVAKSHYSHYPPTTCAARGSFPLDHGGQCKAEMLSFAACIRQHDSAHHPCRELSRAYLECRMQRGLMAPEDLNSMGFDPAVAVVPGPDHAPVSGEVVAGLTAARKPKGAMFGIGLGK